MAMNTTVIWAVLNMTGEYLNTTSSWTDINTTDTLLNKTVSWVALNTTDEFVNSSTTLEDIDVEEEEEEEDWGNEWPYFEIFGKPYFSFMMVIVSLGLIGNVLTFILMRDMTIQTFAYSVYIRWIAISDSVVLITTVMDEFLETYDYRNAFYASHVLVCTVVPYIRMILRILSPWLVVALTLDRFVCVVLPLSRYKLCTKSKAVIMCSILTLASAVLSIDQLTQSVIIKEKCQYVINVPYYYIHIVIELFLTPILPCFLVFILNVIIIIRIRQSTLFRETFRQKSTEEKDEKTDKKDKATLPLVLVSVFAFITLIPNAIAEAVEFLLEMTKADRRAELLAIALWPVFNMIHLFNFGQNFYIMIAFSDQYRKIMKRKLSCLNIMRKSSSEETNSSNVSSRIARSSVVSTQNTESGT